MTEEAKRGRGRPRKEEPDYTRIKLHGLRRTRDGWERLEVEMTEEEAIELGRIAGAADVRERQIAVIGSEMRKL